MTCDYDNDHFNQELNFSIPVKAVIVMVNSHSQKCPEVPCLEVKRYCSLILNSYLSK